MYVYYYEMAVNPVSLLVSRVECIIIFLLNIIDILV